MFLKEWDMWSSCFYISERTAYVPSSDTIPWFLALTLSPPTAERREVVDLRETRKPQIYAGLDSKSRDGSRAEACLEGCRLFSLGEVQSSEEVYNNPVCLQGRVIPPFVLGFGSVGSNKDGTSRCSFGDCP